MGVIGGYTTFSTYAQEALDLVDARDVAEAVAYIGGSVCSGSSPSTWGAASAGRSERV